MFQTSPTDRSASTDPDRLSGPRPTRGFALADLRRPLLVGAGWTLLVWVLLGVPVGVVAALGTPSMIIPLALLLSPLPGVVGAWRGATAAAAVLDDRMSRAAIGIGGVSITMALTGLLELLSDDPSSIWLTVILPLGGGLAGAWRTVR